MFALPTALEVHGTTWNIRSDYRDVIRVIEAMNDPELEPQEKVYVAMFIIYEDFQNIPDDDYKEAFEKACEFIDYGDKSERRSKTKLVDFEQDEKLIISAVNKVVGCEIRAIPYMHWWTFLGYFMEIGECSFSTVLSIRSKRAEGKKLEKWEQEYFDKNRDVVVIRERMTEQEKVDYEKLKSLL